MKKLLLFVLLPLPFFLFTKDVSARTTCNMLPGNIQCFRSWCNSGQVKVCESNRFCFCYDPGETIQEGACIGTPADPSLPPNSCVTFTGENAQSDALVGCSGNAVNTAIGCIPVDNPSSLIGFILRWAMGIGGGIAFLLIVIAGFQIMTSSGNPERLKAGQELLTSAITGILLLIFSVFILELVGVDILGIPGFKTP